MSRIRRKGISAGSFIIEKRCRVIVRMGQQNCKESSRRWPTWNFRNITSSVIRLERFQPGARHSRIFDQTIIRSNRIPEKGKGSADIDPSKVSGFQSRYSYPRMWFRSEFQTRGLKTRFGSYADRQKESWRLELNKRRIRTERLLNHRSWSGSGGLIKQIFWHWKIDMNFLNRKMSRE